MPKALDKKRKRKRSAASNTSRDNSLATNGNETKIPPKRKKLKPAEGIAKSKQLANKSKNTRTPVTRSSTSKNTEPRICGNGKPMPSLAELEQMFEDSDNDLEPAATNNPTVPERSKTPEPKPLVVPQDNLISPRTLKQITTKMMDVISNLPTITLDEGPPPPVVPQKKRKKSDVPYIVGCKERTQVPWQPKTKFGSGHEDYGIKESNSSSDDEDDSCPRKRRTGKVNLSKSIFNAKSDEIAAQLKELEKEESLPLIGSPDSNKTVGYDYTCNSPSQNLSKSFSPLPSTSRDMDTFLRNDERLNESLQSVSNSIDRSPDNDIEVIDIPCETIIVDDSICDKKVEVSKPLSSYEEDDCIILDSDILTKKSYTYSPIRVDSPDDIYGTLDLTKEYNDDITEVIDVDDVIAENEAIIKKYREGPTLDVVTLVEPGTSYIPKERIVSQTNTQAGTGVIASSITENICQPEVIEVNDITNCNSSNNSVQQQIQSNIANVVQNFFQSQTSGRINSPNEIVMTPAQESIISMISSLNHPFSSRRLPICDNSNNRHFHESINLNDNRSIPISPRRRNQMQNEYDLPSGFVVTNMTSVPANRLVSNQNSITTSSKNKSSQINTSSISNEPHQSTVMRSLGDCPICMDNLANNAVASTLCGHVFCMDCIKAAIKANGKKCPTCRKGLKGVGYHQLFL